MSSFGIQEECLDLKICFGFIIRTGILGRMKKNRKRKQNRQITLEGHMYSLEYDRDLRDLTSYK